ncbi:unnamed protein product [Merluccius merluccius]
MSAGTTWTSGTTGRPPRIPCNFGDHSRASAVRPAGTRTHPDPSGLSLMGQTHDPDVSMTGRSLRDGLIRNVRTRPSLDGTGLICEIKMDLKDLPWKMRGS